MLEVLLEKAEVPLPGWALVVGSDPQAARLSVPRAKTAASLATRALRFGFAEAWSRVMRVLSNWGAWAPGVVPEMLHPQVTAGLALPMPENVRKRVVRLDRSR